MVTKEEEKMVKQIKAEGQNNDDADNIFLTEEIAIEELAIDGICGVY